MECCPEQQQTTTHSGALLLVIQRHIRHMKLSILTNELRASKTQTITDMARFLGARSRDAGCSCLERSGKIWTRHGPHGEGDKSVIAPKVRKYLFGKENFEPSTANARHAHQADTHVYSRSTHNMTSTQCVTSPASKADVASGLERSGWKEALHEVGRTWPASNWEGLRTMPQSLKSFPSVGFVLPLLAKSHREIHRWHGLLL